MYIKKAALYRLLFKNLSGKLPKPVHALHKFLVLADTAGG
jgi:hypothetical protein